MSATQHSKLSDSPVTESALLDLCRPFMGEASAAASSFVPECTVVQPDQIPFPEDQLLVHHGHMTEVLEKHHGSGVAVHVLEEHLDETGDVYTRKISLTPRDEPGKVVEWGIVRMDFRYMAPEVRDEILAKQLPLGAVLIKHNVLRRIKPRWFLRFPEGGPVLRLFGPPSVGGGAAYGRVGTIYFNDEPAIEVLEIVVNAHVRDAEAANGRVRVAHVANAQHNGGPAAPGSAGDVTIVDRSDAAPN